MSSADAAITFPNDLEACHALLEQLADTINDQANALGDQAKEIDELKLAYAALLQRAFRRRSERYLDDPNQLKLDFNDSLDGADAAEGLAQAVEEAEQTVKEHTRRRRKPRNEKLPDHLERYEVVVDVPDEVANCAQHGPRKLIGYDTTETLEFERPILRVRVTKYPKYICEDSPECGVASPERAIGLVQGDRYDTSVAAEVLTGKYGYHLPVYRLQDYFAGSGWAPARSTLLNLLTASAFVIRPLVAVAG